MQKLLLALPAYNESAVVAESVRAVHAWATERLGDFDWDIVVADNGSTDDTMARARSIGLSRVSVFHTDEKGRGQVLRRLWMSRDADFYTHMDIDLSTSLESFEKIVRQLAAGAPVAIGSRLATGAQVDRSWLREIISRCYNWMVECVVPLGVRDAQCGAKGVSRAVVRTVVGRTEDIGWFFDTELIALARAAGFRIIEVPVTWVEERYPGRKSKVKIFKTAWEVLRGLLRLRRRLRSRILDTPRV